MRQSICRFYEKLSCTWGVHEEIQCAHSQVLIYLFVAVFAVTFKLFNACSSLKHKETFVILLFEYKKYDSYCMWKIANAIHLWQGYLLFNFQKIKMNLLWFTIPMLRYNIFFVTQFIHNLVKITYDLNWLNLYQCFEWKIHKIFNKMKPFHIKLLSFAVSNTIFENKFK